MLLALHEIWPEAPLFTAVYDPKRASWASVFEVKTSFLQYFPLAKSYHEFYPWLTSMAFETFSFDQFDVVISVTSAEAKSIITKPQTLHICYCLTPTRYLWSGYEQYIESPGLGKLGKLGSEVLKNLAPRLRRWDLIAASRPDYYLAISMHVANRISTFYNRQVEKVIYPPVGLNSKSEIQNPKQIKNLKLKIKNYFLVVSRLVSYKRVDLVVDAFNELGWPLVIIGDGLARNQLIKQANKNITFIARHLTDSELSSYYGDCRALVMVQDEDFGITAVEALLHGKPVITFVDSGVVEVIEDGKTGLFFSQQSKDSLVSALKLFVKKKFDPSLCKASAMDFSKKRFKNEMKETVEKLYKNYI